MGRYVIGVDNGGTFIKAALYDEHGRMVSLAREASRTIIPEPGRVEINLNELWAINCRCIAQVLAESGVPAGEVECVGFAGQGKGVYAVDSNGMAFCCDPLCHLRIFPDVFAYQEKCRLYVPGFQHIQNGGGIFRRRPVIKG